MPVLSTTAQFDNLREDATRPITLIRWEHSGGLECISLNGDCEYDGELYISGHIDGDSLKITNNDSATFTLPVTDDRLSECLNGRWRNGKICQIYEIPATVDDEDFVYTEADAILKLDGIIDDSRYSNGTITVTVLHKYLVSKFTPRYMVNEFFANIPSPGSFLKVGTDKYQLKSRREVKKDKFAARKGLRGRLTTQENNTFTPDDKALDVEMTADGAILPIVYGRQPVPGLICANGVDGSGNFIYVVAWCMGPILDIVKIFNNDVEIDPAAIVHNYRGILCQGLDTIATTITGITYTDTGKLLTADGYACAAYSVIYLPSSTTVTPRFQAIIKGRTVYDPRQDGGSTLLTAGTFPDPFNKGDMTAVGYNLQFIGTNGTSPTTGIDFSSYAHTITYAGNAQIQSNKLSLDGTGDYVTVPSNSNTRFGTGRWTLEITCTPSVHGEINALYGVGAASGGSDYCIVMTQIATALYVSMSSTGTTWDIASAVDIDNTAFLTARTTQIVVEFDGRGYFFYIDGVQKYYIASTSTLNASTSTIQIGRNQSSSSGDEFKGTISGVRFTKGYNRYGGIHTNVSSPYPDSASNESGYVYSDTAAGVFADLVKNPYYGLGSTETIDGLLNMWKWNEVVYGGVARGVVSLVISDKRPTVEWLDQICGTYGESFWFTEGDGITVRPDRMGDKYNPSGWELTTNGTFLVDADDWTLAASWAHTGGASDLISGGATGSVTAATQTLGKPTVAGDVYVVTMSIDFITGLTLRVDIDDVVVIEAQSTLGVYAAEFTATGSESVISLVQGSATGAAIVGELSVRRKYWRDDTLIAGSLSVVPLRNSDAPNRIIATYKNSSTTTANWPDEAPVTISMPGVGTDGTPVLETRIRYDGLKNSVRTTIRAKTKLYRLQGKDSVTWITTDAGLLYQRGMVIELYDAEFDLLIYALLDTVEKIEPGRFRCMGNRYSETHYPADQTTQTGPVPVGLILPLFASTVPSGYSAYTTANSKYIKCAGESVTVASTGGATTASALTGDTSTDGEHGSGEPTFPVKAYTGTGGAGVGKLFTVTEDDAGDHDHTFTTGTITPTLYRRELMLVKKITTPGTSLPAEVMVFGQVGLRYPDTFRYTAIAKRLVYAASAVANGGTLQQYIPITTGYTDDTHDHVTYTDITNGTPSGTAVTASHYPTGVGGSIHAHAVTIELTRNVKKHKMCLYASGATYGMGPGMMGFWEDTIANLHQDFTICDGRLGTPFVEGRLLEIAARGEEDQRRGNNTLLLNGTTRWSAKHDHDGVEDTTDVAAAVEVSHNSRIKHRHTITSPDPATPLVHNDWEPPYYALYLVMYNPNPVPTQFDVALLIDGDQASASTTIVDVSKNSLTATISGSGTLAYSSAQTLFGINTLLAAGKRVLYPTLAHGKKWSVQGYFRNNATGLLLLFSNFEVGHDTQTYSVQKNASGNIELYIGTTLRATVTLTLTSNEWFYCSLCYDYAEFRLYAGRVSTGVATRATYTSAAYDAWPKFCVFDFYAGLSTIWPFTGYASQIRFTTGAAIHSGSTVAIPETAFQNWHSSHTLSGAYDWWDPCGIVDGHYTNLLPDKDPAAFPNNPGGRASIWQETGVANSTIRVVWPGVHADGKCGIMACMVPSDTDFALGFNYESALGLWVLWKLGKQPSDISYLGYVAGDHTDGVPVVLSVVISGTSTITCKADGTTVITATIPAGLQGSTKHGIFIDVNRVPGRPKNVPGLLAPFYCNLAEWAFESGEWDDAGYWLDRETV